MGDENLNKAARERARRAWEQGSDILLNAHDIGMMLERNQIEDLDQIESLVSELASFGRDMERAIRALGEEDE